MRRAHKVDKTQDEIVRVLRKVGASVWDTSAVGGDAPDLVVGFGGITYLLELKSDGGKCTPGQTRWHARWRGTPVAVVRNADEALRAIGAIGRARKPHRTICPECGEAPRHCACAINRAAARELIPEGFDVARS